MAGPIIRYFGQGGSTFAHRWGLIVPATVLGCMAGFRLRQGDWSGWPETLLLSLLGAGCFVFVIEMCRRLGSKDD